MKRLIAVSVVALSLVSCIAGAAATLKPGSEAPAIKVSSWAKGKPIATLEKGKTYVVEFWATWCGPCKSSIPHLTELAKKYKDKVTFIGVNIWDAGNKGQADYEKRISTFVKDMGSKMEYNVALDDLKGTMAQTWMTASGENGIPTAFVIGKDGKVAWIGHPGSLDGILSEVMAGKFNVDASAKQREAEKATQNKIQAIAVSAQKLANEKKFTEAIAVLDKAINENPTGPEISQFQFMKVDLLLSSDEKAGYAFVKELSDGKMKDDPHALIYLAFVVSKNKAVKTLDYDLIISIAERAGKLNNYQDPWILNTLALTYAGKGDFDKAAEMQQKAVDAVNKASDSPEDVRKGFQTQLDAFKAKKLP